MTIPFTRADSLREYLTGASVDGGSQDLPNLSLGNFRSSTEAQSFAIRFNSFVNGIIVTFVANSNATGVGVLSCLNANTIQWTPPGSIVPGPPVTFTTSGQTLVIEGSNPSQYLRVQALLPFATRQSSIRIAPLQSGVFSMNNVLNADAIAGVSQYRATVIRNVAGSDVINIARWIKELATSKVSNVAVLPSSGAGTIQTSTALDDWPTSGWCRIDNTASSGIVREVVYYTTRTRYALTVTRRGLLGTTAAGGAVNDVIHAVPGIAIALDLNGVVASNVGLAATLANDRSTPPGLTWNVGITKAAGLQIARIQPGQQIGIWIWRQVPPGAIFTPNAYSTLNTDFFAY